MAIHKINKDIVVDVGADFSKVFKIKVAGTDTGRDITGWTFVGKIKTSFSGTVIETLNCTIVDASNGEFKIALTDSQTAALTTTNEATKRTALMGVYTVDSTDNSGNVQRVLEGRAYLARTTI